MTRSSVLESRPLCLLSLDGGGVRGLSQLIMLDEIMHQLEGCLNSREHIAPSSVFHLIGGTSTGGLVTLLLGRLHMTTSEAISCYTEIAEKVFSTSKLCWQDGSFKASAFEKAIGDAVEAKLGPGHRDDLMYDFNSSSSCKSFVCAVEAHHISKVPTKFRTWKAARNPGENCKIWEAARATSAAPHLFKRMVIGKRPRQLEFVDGALGCNNPIRHVFSEAICEFDHSRPLGCILSIGTGEHRVPGFTRPGIIQRIIPTNLAKIVARLATDTNEDHQLMEDKFEGVPGFYHRLNVGPEVGEIGLGEWTRLNEIEAHTRAYLDNRDVQTQLDVIVRALAGRPPRTTSLGMLNRPRIQPQPEDIKYHCVPGSERDELHFVERSEANQIDQYFESIERGGHSTTLVLLGMGGCGKTQLALYCYRRARSSPSFGGTLWLDGTSKATMSKSLEKSANTILSSHAKNLDKEQTKRAVLKKIEESAQPWLVVIDNYDDPGLFDVDKYLPRQGKRLVIVTSRSTETTGLGVPIKVGGLNEREALCLLFGKDSVETRARGETDCGLAIVRRLGCLPLAIAQASAYIRDRNMDLGYFLKVYEEENRSITESIPKVWEYRRRGLQTSDDPDEKMSHVRLLSVATTWELSLTCISGDERTKRAKIQLLVISAFLGRTDITEDLFTRYWQGTDDRTRPAWMQAFTTLHHPSLPSSSSSATRPAPRSRLNTHLFQNAIAELGRLSLLQSHRINSRGATWRFHPVVQDWACHRQSPEECQQLALLAAEILQHSLHQTSGDPVWLAQEEGIKPGAKPSTSSPSADSTHQRTHIDLCPHVDACYNNCTKMIPPDSEDSLGSRKTAIAALKFADFFRSDGRYTQAEELQRRVIAQTDPSSPEHRLALRQLATNLRTRGDYHDAALIQEAAVSRLVTGTEDMDGAFELLELSRTYQYQARRPPPETHTPAEHQQHQLEQHQLMSKAVDLATRGLEVVSNLRGADSLAAASAMGILGEVAYHNKDYAQARSVEEKVFAIRTLRLGPESHFTLQAKDDLAITLAKQGEYATAARMHEEVRNVRLQTLGKMHPSTLETERMLARAWRMAGGLRSESEREFLGKARVLNEDILQRAIQAFGKEHWDTRRAAVALWRCLVKQRLLEKAEDLRGEYGLVLNSAEVEMLREAVDEMGLRTPARGPAQGTRLVPSNDHGCNGNANEKMNGCNENGKVTGNTNGVVGAEIG